MTDLHELSALELAGAIRRGETSSREALEHLLDRIDRLDGPINAVVTIDAGAARAAADAADAARRAGWDLGPLHGVPMTVKDSFQTAGMRTTSGAPELAEFVPSEDAWPVARLREAGAVIFGKTNLPIYAGDLQSYNEVFGTTSNPWNPERTPGGSSGGSAAALAARFTPLELGSDIGGSIRVPAHCCGVMGHKPSYGIVPAHGQIPGPPGTLTQADLAVAGPMARTVDDLEAGLDILAGPDRWMRPAWRLRLPPARRGPLRVAAWFDEPDAPVEPGVRTLLDRAAGVLGAEDARPDIGFPKLVTTFRALLSAALSGGFAASSIEQLAEASGDSDADAVRRWTAMRHREWLTHNERRLQMRARMEEFFERYDVVLLPVLGIPAFPHDQSPSMADRTVEIAGERRPYLHLMYWMSLAGACYLPATVVPVGLTDDGLPVGVQIVGPHLEDRTTLAAARILEEAFGGCQTPPLGA